MSASIATGSAAQSVQKLVIDSDVENQLRSEALLRRLRNKILSHGSIELRLRCPNITATGLGWFQPFSGCLSLQRVDLSGCLKLESIPTQTFGYCRHLVSVVFGEYSNITNLRANAFQECFALKSIITLPNKLKIIDNAVFSNCSALERVVYNKILKTICVCAFNGCSKLEDVQLASKSISFGLASFGECDRLIERATVAGFPSQIVETVDFGKVNTGDGVVPYLINRFERSERKRFVLLALMRFKNAVHTHDGTEEEKVTAAKKHHPRPPSMPHLSCFTCKAKRRPTRMLRLCAGCNNTWFCHRQCQIDG